ncbi:hypothetical protein ABZ208_15245 [Streptomyces sp. NPDC006208]|uniref:hypothetical protein n=1 Tax=Streptomyces sp. NPDC006208 TaxID=3156734 RepID=UPI0033B351DE
MAKAAAEHIPAGVDAERVHADVDRPHAVLDDARTASRLPSEPSAETYARPADFVVRVRLE